MRRAARRGRRPAPSVRRRAGLVRRRPGAPLGGVCRGRLPCARARARRDIRRRRGHSDRVGRARRARASARRRRSKRRRWKQSSRAWPRDDRAATCAPCVASRSRISSSAHHAASWIRWPRSAAKLAASWHCCASPPSSRAGCGCPTSSASWGIDSGIRHAVTGADYWRVRVGAFMGYRILAELAGLARDDGRSRRPRPRATTRVGTGTSPTSAVDDLPSIRARRSPSALDGSDVPGALSGDDRSRDPRRSGAPLRHPHADRHTRCTSTSAWREWARHLRSATPRASCDAARLGALMYESHASYSACGLGSKGTDRLVALAREAGPGRRHLRRQDHRRRKWRHRGGAGRRWSGRARFSDIARRYAEETGRGRLMSSRASLSGRLRPRHRAEPISPRARLGMTAIEQPATTVTWPTASAMMRCSEQSARSSTPVTRPSCMTTTRSLRWSISSMSLLIITIDTPSRASARSSR